MTSVDVDEIAERLYALPPDEFTAARDETAREAPDATVKKAVKGLRKPTAAAHEVNRLVRERTGDVDALLDLGDAMRAAMTGDPAELRRLTEERRRLIGTLVDADLPTGVQQDVTATLEAATADSELGAAVRSGRLVKPLRYAGFGAMPDLDDAVATPLRRGAATTSRATGKATPTASKKGATKAPGKPPQEKSAPQPDPATPRPDLTAARDRVLELAGIADDAQRRFDTAVKAATEARRLLDHAETERAAAHKAARAAHAEAEKARRELGRLERS
jgi:hypothetical protein